MQLHVLLLSLIASVFQTALCGDSCHGSHFMSYNSIKNKSPLCFDDLPDTVKPIERGVYLMPDMNFTCSGKIKGILVGARIDTRIKVKSRPQLQIWRQEPLGENFVTLVSSHTIDISETFYSADVHFYYNFPNPIDFNDGDFIGFYQPPEESNVRIFYTTETFMTKQSVYVDNSSNVDNEIHATINISYALDNLHATEKLYMLFRPQINAKQSCLNGFLDYGEVKSRSKYINPLKYNHRQLRIFPDVHFDCPMGKGFLSEITFGAQTRESSDANILLPELQIWRRGSEANSYYRVHSIPLIKNESGISNVHEIWLNPPVEFMNRDIIGLFQPDVAMSQLVVFYQETSGPENLIVGSNIDQPSPTAVASLNETGGNDYPLLTVNIITATPVTTESSMGNSNTGSAVVSESSTIPSSTQPSTVPTDSNNLIIIIAAIIGVSVLMLLILIVSILTAIMCYKVKQQKKKNTQLQQTNTSSFTAVPNSPDSKTSQVAMKDMTMSHNYDECVKMEHNFSYGIISPKDLKVNPSYNINNRSVSGDTSRDSYISISSRHYEVSEEYVLPLPLDSEDSGSHIYY